MIPPESAGWANLKSKAACCQAATNLVDRDWELLIRIDYNPYPNSTTFTKLGYPVFSHIHIWMLLCNWQQKYSAIHVKICQTILQVVVLWDDCRNHPHPNICHYSLDHPELIHHFVKLECDLQLAASIQTCSFLPRLMILPKYRSQFVIPLGNKTGKNIVHANIFQMTVTVAFKFCDLSKCFDSAYICCKVN